MTTAIIIAAAVIVVVLAILAVLALRARRAEQHRQATEAASGHRQEAEAHAARANANARTRTLRTVDLPRVENALRVERIFHPFHHVERGPMFESHIGLTYGTRSVFPGDSAALHLQG